MLSFVIRIIFLWYLNSIIIYSQNDLIKQKNHADSVFLSENYFDAIKEYKRLLFFDKEGLFNYTVYNQIALCYKYGGKLENAFNYFSLALTKANSNREIFECKLNLCRLNIIENKTKNAHRILNELENDSLFVAFQEEIKYWRAWIFFYEKDYENASLIFHQLNEIELFELSKQNQEQSLSINKAKILSMILPGAGQIYSENYLSGIGSFIWNLIAGYLTINAFASERIFDGIVLTNILWMRFHRGNLENAEKLAEKKNQIIFINSLINIQNNFRNKFP